MEHVRERNNAVGAVSVRGGSNQELRVLEDPLLGTGRARAGRTDRAGFVFGLIMARMWLSLF